MSRKVGWYSAKKYLAYAPEVVLYDGCGYYKAGIETALSEKDFYWISDKPIVPEEPPVVLEVGSWYLFSKYSDTMIGQCKATDIGVKYMWVANSRWWYVDQVTILAGPFTVDELIKLKPF